MDRFVRLVILTSLLSSAAACLSARGTSASSVGLPAPGVENSNAELALRPGPDSTCNDCSAAAFRGEITRAVETRIADLKTRGGDCTRLGAVIESSYRSGQITLRPYMWRVGSHLASGEAKPNGDMVLAREIDSLNVGVRTIDDVLWTMEHEAAHIAFDLASGNEASEEKANQTVRACT